MSTEGLMDGLGSATGSRSLLRRMNTLGLLERISTGPMTMTELVDASGLSRTTVDGVLTDLLAQGWAEAVDAPGGRLGRPAAAFGPAVGLGVQAAVDVGANHIHAVLAGWSGGVIERVDVRVAEDEPAEGRLRRSAGLVDQLLTAAGRTRQDLWILGVGSPGTIDDGRVGFFGGEGMPGWVGQDLRRWFAQHLDVPVVVEGDVALGAEAELAFGAARSRQDVVYVLCGVRTSGALIIGGRVRRGVHGAAGIVGELPQLRWAELEATWSAGLQGDTRPRREEVFRAARSGDPAARAATDEFADALATGAAALVLAVDPELLVIGGGSAPAADVFLPRFSASLARICPVVPALAVSTLGSDAVALGALSLGRRCLHSVLAESVRHGEAFPDPRRARLLLRDALA